MALAVQNPQLVWSKVKKHLANAKPASQLAFKGLREYLTTQGGNPDLQLVTFSEAQAIVNLGTDLIGGACTVYGWFGKATRTSGTTSAFLALHAAADNSATTTTLITQRIKAAGQEFAWTSGTGIAAETGLTISSATAVGGATESTTPDGADGFVIVGV